MGLLTSPKRPGSIVPAVITSMSLRPLVTLCRAATLADNGESSFTRRTETSSGYELSKLDDPAYQAELTGRVVAESLTCNETVAEVRRIRAGGGSCQAAGSQGQPVSGPSGPSSTTVSG